MKNRPSFFLYLMGPNFRYAKAYQTHPLGPPLSVSATAIPHTHGITALSVTHFGPNLLLSPIMQGHRHSFLAPISCHPLFAATPFDRAYW